MFQAYIALLHPDGTEPDKRSGYCRTYIGETEETDLEQLLQTRWQVVFPDVLPPGYDIISACALFSQSAGGIPIDACGFPEARNVRPGVVPVIHQGRLWMGVDVQANVTVTNDSSCNARGGFR